MSELSGKQADKFAKRMFENEISANEIKYTYDDNENFMLIIIFVYICGLVTGVVI